MERFGDVGALDDNVESFLSNDAGDGANLYGTIKQSPAEQPKEPPRSKLSVCLFSVYKILRESMINHTFISAFTFAEFSCIRTRSNVTSCHFSSDGKLLASAGEDKKVICVHNEYTMSYSRNTSGSNYTVAFLYISSVK
jgi:WD40 repeat protein